MASCMEWHLPQCKSRLTTCSKIKVGNIAKTVTWMHSPNLVLFFLSPAKLNSACPISNCLAASNGICTKRNTAQFELLLFENEVKNNSQTWPLIHLTAWLLFILRLLLKWVKLCRWKNIINMKWIWTKWVLGDLYIMLPFYLILTRRPNITVNRT